MSELSEIIFANSTLPSKSTGTWGCNELDGDTKYIRADRHEELCDDNEALRSLLREAECPNADKSLLTHCDNGKMFTYLTPFKLKKDVVGDCDFCTRRSQLLGEGNER